MANFFSTISRKSFALAGAVFFLVAMLVSAGHVATHLDHHIPQASAHHHSGHDVEHTDSNASHCPICDFIKKTDAIFQLPRLLSSPVFVFETNLDEGIFRPRKISATSYLSRGPPPLAVAT